MYVNQGLRFNIMLILKIPWELPQGHTLLPHRRRPSANLQLWSKSLCLASDRSSLTVLGYDNLIFFTGISGTWSQQTHPLCLLLLLLQILSPSLTTLLSSLKKYSRGFHLPLGFLIVVYKALYQLVSDEFSGYHTGKISEVQHLKERIWQVFWKVLF